MHLTVKLNKTHLPPPNMPMILPRFGPSLPMILLMKGIIFGSDMRLIAFMGFVMTSLSFAMTSGSVRSCYISGSSISPWNNGLFFICSIYSGLKLLRLGMPPVASTSLPLSSGFPCCLSAAERAARAFVQLVSISTAFLKLFSASLMSPFALYTYPRLK